jgi:hypothetical protein
MSKRMRPLPTADEMALETLAGTARAVAKGTVSKEQLNGLRKTLLRWGLDLVVVDATITNQKAPPRAGEIV